MLEILILISLGRNIAAQARAKGRSGPAYVFLLLGFWFGGEILGAIAAAVISVAVTGEDEPNMLAMYVAALVTAIIGAVIAFKIVGALPPVETEFDEAEPDEEWERERH